MKSCGPWGSSVGSCAPFAPQLCAFRTDAIIVHSTRKQAKKAKEVLLDCRRDALHRAAPRLFGERLARETPGQGDLFRVFNCKSPPQHRDGSLLDLQRRTPHVLPEVIVINEGSATSKSWS